MIRRVEELTPSLIQGELDRILASKMFRSSQRMCDFLRYLVDEYLSDHTPRLKEFAIGMAVFERDETFDPRLDSVVRVEAGRLRAKLAEYYAGPGADAPVVITIPKGGYVPEFTLIDRTSGRESDRRVSSGVLLSLASLLTLAGIGLAVTLIMRSGQEGITPAANPELRTIAVMPLRDWSANPEDYFSEGMTDVLIARLSERPGLRVTSVSSVMKYKNAELAPSEIAQALGVRNILEGTIIREANQVRITATLIDGDTDRNVWSGTYNRPITSALTLQDHLASEIASQLVGRLYPVQREASPVNQEAYEAYLKGVYWRNRLTPQGFNRGIQYFQQAIDIQPDYAEAYASMAACHCRLAGQGIEIVRPALALPQAAALANKALALDSTLAEPNAVLGIISFKYEWNAAAARENLESALEINPSLFEALLWYSQISEGLGQKEIAIEFAENAHRVNPLSLAANLNLGWQLYQGGHIAEAEVQFDRLVEFNPEFWGGYWGKGHIFRARALYSEAIDEFSQAVALEGGHSMPMATLGYTYGVSGRSDEARLILDELLEASESNYVSPVHIAMVYAGLDEPETSLDWLDKAYTVRARSLAWLTVRQEFEGLRSNPRYQALVREIGITGK